MPTWDPQQYTQFAEQRERPCRDLIAAIHMTAPARIADLGCGPGNSTALLAKRWPASQIVGVDSSSEMLETARRELPTYKFQQDEISAWSMTGGAPWDLVFSNAALQWVPHHEQLFPALLSRVRPGGALAVQVPADPQAPPHAAARELAASKDWRSRFAAPITEWHAEPPARYYDVLSVHTIRLDLWTTTYLHPLPSVEHITEWYRGSGLRPYLDALPTKSLREQFTADYTARLRPLYPARPDGKVLLPFLRLFLIAYR